MNYFDESTAADIGKDKILSLNGITNFYKGYYFKLQDSPINEDDPSHLTIQKKVNDQLGL